MTRTDLHIILLSDFCGLYLVVVLAMIGGSWYTYYTSSTPSVFSVSLSIHLGEILKQFPNSEIKFNMHFKINLPTLIYVHKFQESRISGSQNAKFMKLDFMILFIDYRLDRNKIYRSSGIQHCETSDSYINEYRKINLQAIHISTQHLCFSYISTNEKYLLGVLLNYVGLSTRNISIRQMILDMFFIHQSIVWFPCLVRTWRHNAAAVVLFHCMTLYTMYLLMVSPSDMSWLKVRI
ncbi:hypothetical protein AGLY_012875 [Aphis glycines]|uniref:Uncharacterized protein n=1 Tax=Aphis glycines TaxID=307491 RepID=A0A6G0TA08_APHGL|nr:hypothetical protein AGLY_012875 [Aphis glycines]